MNGPLGQGTDVLATDAGPEERAHIDYVRTYLHDAVARGLLRPVDAARLDADLAVRAAPAPPPPTALAPPPAPGPAVGPAPVATPAAQGPWASRPPAPAPAPAPTPMPGPAPSGGPVPQPVLQPSAVGAWVLRARESITADLAVHGLADLGVLLLFAGLFGFVAFAFGQVRLGLRPVAEAAIPLVLFGAGAFLRHRGTRVVGEALTFLGGLLLPVVLVASLIDGASPPPDLGGRSLALAMAAGLAALAVAFALLVWRRPSSPLRFLVAPMGWLCTAALGLLLADVPEGAKIVAPEAWSWGLATVAAGASVVAVDVARRRGRSGPLVDGTALAAWPGLPATYGLTLAASAAHGWPVGPLLAAGAAVIVGIDVLGRGRRGWVVPAAQTVPLVVAAAAVAAHESRPEVGAALVVVGALALAERHARRQTVAEAVWALVGVAAAALVVAEAASFGSDDAPLVAVVVGAAAWTWALLRVLRPRGPLGGPALEVGVVAIPLLVGPVAGVGWSEAWSALVLAALLVAGAAAVRATSERERPIWAVAIPLWGWWLLASLVAIASWGSGVAAATSALVAAAFVLAPRFPVLRAWGAVVAVVVAVLAGLDAVDASGMATALVLLGIGLATVLVGEARWRRPVLGHLVLAGQLVIGLGAIGALVVWGDGEADDPSGLMAVAQVAVLVGWAVVALLHEVRWSNLTDLLARRSPRTGDPSHRGVDRYACRIPLGLAVVAYPVAVGTVAASTGRFADDASWPAAIAVAALVPLAWAARVLADRGRRGPSMVCAHIGLAMAVLAGFATIGALDPVWPIAVASAFVVAFVVVEGPARRGAGSTSLGVLASGAAVAALGSIVGVAGSSEAGLVAALWGSMLVVGALVADEQRYGARPRGQVVRSATGWPPVVFGAAGLAGGALMALEGWPEPAGAALMLAAVAVLLVALLLREPWGRSAGGCCCWPPRRRCAGRAGGPPPRLGRGHRRPAGGRRGARPPGGPGRVVRG
ncbi:MAG: hypothetical protein U0P45_14190 [Acidimicrobiales bacterium]